MIDLRQALADYLELRRNMGFQVLEDGRLLGQFLRFLEESKAQRPTTELALAWARQPAHARPAWWAHRLGYVRQFTRYLWALDPTQEIPSSKLIVARVQRRVPYLYSDADIRDLLGAARDLGGGPLRGATYTTLLGLIAATGMRGSEAIGLDRADVDFEQGLLVVRESKFGKSRELPLHDSTVAALRAYATGRDRFCPAALSPAFFLSTAGTRLHRQKVHFTFLGVVRAAGLWNRRPHRPTIHDLRHSFAVAALTQFYREGVDVGPRLAALSTYLGHVGPTSTYWYLTATPELLALVQAQLQRTAEARS